MFVAASGAFGTAWITPDVRYPIIAMLALLGVGIDLAVSSLLKRLVRLRLEPLRAVIRSLLCLVCAILLSWSVARVFEGPRGTPPLSQFVLPVLILAAVVAGVRHAGGLIRPTPGTPDPGPPDFVSRLPPCLQSAEIFAVEGEDHYVRVHTSAGRHLLLMRFSDALSELQRVDGLQTHRSWWIARSAVTGVRRGNGRATLKLANGLEAPVSRRYAPGLRDKGWY